MPTRRANRPPGRRTKRRTADADKRTSGTKILFVSKSFLEKDESEVNAYFENLLKALGIKYQTAEPYTERPIYGKVEKAISDSDLIVGIYVVRYRDRPAKKVLTSTWLIREVSFAKGQGKPFILLVEEGVTDIANFEHEMEIIWFRRGDSKKMQAATIKFLEAIRMHGLVRA